MSTICFWLLLTVYGITRWFWRWWDILALVGNWSRLRARPPPLAVFDTGVLSDSLNKAHHPCKDVGPWPPSRIKNLPLPAGQGGREAARGHGLRTPRPVPHPALRPGPPRAAGDRVRRGGARPQTSISRRGGLGAGPQPAEDGSRALATAPGRGATGPGAGCRGGAAGSAGLRRGAAAPAPWPRRCGSVSTASYTRRTAWPPYSSGSRARPASAAPTSPPVSAGRRPAGSPRAAAPCPRLLAPVPRALTALCSLLRHPRRRGRVPGGGIRRVPALQHHRLRLPRLHLVSVGTPAPCATPRFRVPPADVVAKSHHLRRRRACPGWRSGTERQSVGFTTPSPTPPPPWAGTGARWRTRLLPSGECCRSYRWETLGGFDTW